MGTRPIIYKYPLDRTGVNPNNLIIGEPHTLPSGINRPVVTNYGAFFTESLVVRDASTGDTLVPRHQYKATQLYQDATTYTGKEVCSVIIITDKTVSHEVEIDYQVIGGEYTTSVRAIRELVHDLDLDNRPVAWGDILGKPKGYPPGPHLHDAGDLYGMEYLVEAIERIRQAIMVGNEGTLQEIHQSLRMLDEELRAKILPPASLDDAIAGVRDDVVITPASLRAALIAFANKEVIFEEHLNANNPHETTVAQINLALEGVSELGLLTVSQASEAADDHLKNA